MTLQFNMGWPEWIVVILLLASVFLYCAKHGEEKPPYNATHGVAGVLIHIALLYWGGFFS